MSFARKDWVLQQIAEVARAFSRLLQLEREQRYGEAEELVHQTAESLTGMGYSTLLALDADSIASVLERAERVLALAQVMERDAELRRKAHLEGAEPRELQALALYRIALGRGADAGIAQKAIARITARLADRSP